MVLLEQVWSWSVSVGDGFDVSNPKPGLVALSSCCLQIQIQYPQLACEEADEVVSCTTVSVVMVSPQCYRTLTKTYNKF